MALPAFRSVGTAAGGTGAVTPGLPSGHTTNDILLLFVESANEVVTAPTGWGLVSLGQRGTGTAAGTSATRLSTFWLRDNGSVSAPTVADSGNHTYAVICAYSGCVTDGDPWEVTNGGTKVTSSTTTSVGGATTVTNNCLIVAAVARMNSTASAQFSGETNSSLSSIVERFDAGTISGNGGGIGIIDGGLATAGTYGATSFTHATTSVAGWISIALRSSTPTGIYRRQSVFIDGGSATFSSTVTAGNLIVVGISNFAAVPGATDVTDNQTGNTYTRVVTSTNVDDNVTIFYANNVNSSGTFTITCATPGSMSVFEFVGADTASPLDQSNSATGTSGAPSTSVTTTTAGELYFTAVSDANGDNSDYTPGSGYQMGESDVISSTSERLGTEFQVAASGTVTGNFTLAASSTWTTVMASFKPVSSAVNASVTQVAGTVTASGGTQTVVSVSSATISQVAANVTATGGTQSTTVNVTQVAATVTASGGTQVVASTRLVAVAQVAGTVTASGGTQVVATVRKVSVSQVAATVTATGGTQAIATVNDVSVTQVAATVTASGGTQVVAGSGIVSIAITQVAGTVTATGGTQSIATVNKVQISQLAGVVTASGGTQAVAVPTSGGVYYWDGTHWTFRPTQVWTGSAWVAKPLKRWTGSAWQKVS